MSVRPEDRFATARQFGDALNLRGDVAQLQPTVILSGNEKKVPQIPINQPPRRLMEAFLAGGAMLALAFGNTSQFRPQWSLKRLLY
jgi:hypothetical protein